MINKDKRIKIEREKEKEWRDKLEQKGKQAAKESIKYILDRECLS